MQKVNLISLIIALFIFTIPLSYAQANYVPERCVFPAMLTCQDYLITSNDISLVLVNGAGKDLIIKNTSISGGAVIGECSQYEFITIPAAESAKIIVPCALDSKEIGCRLKYDISITYRYNDSTYYHTIPGELLAAAPYAANCKRIELNSMIKPMLFIVLFILIHIFIWRFISFILRKKASTGQEIGEMFNGIVIAFIITFAFIFTSFIYSFIGTMLDLRKISHKYNLYYDELILVLFLLPVLYTLYVLIKRPKKTRYYYAILLTFFYTALLFFFFHLMGTISG